MNHFNQVRTVAWWEFRRFYKVRDQVLGLTLFLGFGILGYMGAKWAKDTGNEVRVAVIDEAGLNPQAAAGGDVTFEPAEPTEEPSLRERVADKESGLNGLLIIRSADEAELIARSDPGWRGDVELALGQARTAAKLREAGVTPAQLGDILAPVKVTFTRAGGRDPVDKAAKRTAAAFVGLTMIGVWVGLAFFLVGVTGEKQMRVTEQVVAAVSPQAWIDGKVVGLTGVALATMLTYAASAFVTLGVVRAMGASFELPSVATDPGLIATFALLAVLGIAFWNCVFAAVAATINDPYTSARGSFMFLPTVPVGVVAFLLSRPESLGMTVLSFVPGVVPTGMMARLVLTDVAAWEVVSAVALQLVAIWGVRRLAGKVFAAGMLTYGKQPSLGEITRWLREA